MAFLDQMKKLPEEAALALGKLAALTHSPEVLINECESLKAELLTIIADIDKVEAVIKEIQGFEELVAPAAPAAETASVSVDSTTTTEVHAESQPAAEQPAQ